MLRTNRIKRMIPLLSALILLLSISLVLSCSRGAVGPGDDPATASSDDMLTQPREEFRLGHAPGQHGYYASYDFPDKLMLNFTIAWRTLDAGEYTDVLLYSGEEPAVDGEVYAPFMFYFAFGLDYWGNPMPAFWTFDEERLASMCLLDGKPGEDGVPPVESISLTFTPAGVWMPPAHPGHAEGDPYPEGTRRRLYNADLTVELSDFMPGTQIDQFHASALHEFHVIPIVVEYAGGERVVYRLWKWRELSEFAMPGQDGGLREMSGTTWSAVKLLYMQ